MTLIDGVIVYLLVFAIKSTPKRYHFKSVFSFYLHVGDNESKAPDRTTKKKKTCVNDVIFNHRHFGEENTFHL